MLPMELNPVAFSFGWVSVYWYGIILGLAALSGLLIAIQEGKRFGITNDFFLDLMLYGVPSAIICARLYYVAFKWDHYRAHPAEIIQIWEGGIAIYGALIGALVCGFFYIRAKGYSFWRIVDICVPSLLIGQMIGRWGNFVNQEAHGGPVEESFLRDTLHLPRFIVDQMNIGGTYYHPTFLYESLWSLLGLVLLFVIRRQRFLRAGEMFATYFIWYSVGRFFIEPLRTDSLAFEGPAWLVSLLDVLWSPMKLVFEYGHLDPAEGNIRISQLLSLLIIIGCLVFVVIRRSMGYAKERYLDPVVSSKQKDKPTEVESRPAIQDEKAQAGNETDKAGTDEDDKS